MKRAVALFLILLIALGSFASCKKYDEEDVASTTKRKGNTTTTQKTTAAQTTAAETAESLIEKRISDFSFAYNSGDMDEVLKSFDAKTRNALKAMINIFEGIAGSASKFSLDLSDLFSLGVNTTSGDFMGIEITDIQVTDSENAIVTANMELAGSQPQTVYFEMIYEQGGWYIHDMNDKKPTIVQTPTTDEKHVAPSSAGTFSDGVATVSYTLDNVKYNGIINTKGKVIYATQEEAQFISIGKGATIVSLRDEKTYDRYPKYIVDATGKVVATLDDGLTLAAYGDGMVLLYQRKETITEIQHNYAIMDASGNWLQPMINLGLENPSECYYAGSGMFAVNAWNGYYSDAFIFWNAQDGKMFFLSGLEEKIWFIDDVAFAYRTDYSRLINPFDISNLDVDYEGEELPGAFLLYKDGKYDEIDLSGIEIKNYANGHLSYTTQEDEGKLFITNIFDSDQAAFVYDAYPANIVHSVQFVGEYGLLIITGANTHLYFTLIDKQGNQLFEPIETGYNDNWSNWQSILFDGDTVVYEDKNDKYCLANAAGEVTVTEYVSIDQFSDGIARAYIQGGAWSDNSVVVYIDKNNEQIIATIELPEA